MPELDAPGSMLLLSTDPVQRLRLSQAGLAMLLMAAGVVAMHYFVLVDVAPRAAGAPGGRWPRWAAWWCSSC